MNMQAMMQQAQKMQRDIQKKQEEINNTEFIGKSEWIEVVMTGDKKLKSVKVIYEQNIETDDKEVLEDMFLIAMNDVLKQIDDETESKMGQYANLAGGLF